MVVVYGEADDDDDYYDDDGCGGGGDGEGGGDDDEDRGDGDDVDTNRVQIDCTSMLILNILPECNQMISDTIFMTLDPDSRRRAITYISYQVQPPRMSDISRKPEVHPIIFQW